MESLDDIYRIVTAMATIAAAVVAATLVCHDVLRALCLLLVAELFFAAYYFTVKRATIHQRPQRHAPKFDEPDRTVANFLRRPRSVIKDVYLFLQQWCLGTPFEEMGRENALDLMSYAFWYNTLDEMKAAGLADKAERLLDSLEQIFNIKFKPGRNPACKFMDHLWQDVPHSYRPLAFYGVMELLALFSHVVLLLAGFEHSQLEGVSYYTANLGGSSSHKRSRAKAGQQQQQTPLVFIHGVGVGFPPYLAFIFKLARTGRPLIVPEVRHVSMRLTQSIPTVDDMAGAVRSMLAGHGITKACIMGHSYGSMVASRFVQDYKKCVDSLVLIDPVCFHIYLPSLLYNFLYCQQFNSGNLVLDAVMHLAATEMHCCATMCRGLFWTRINLWEEELPERSLVVLSGKDVLVDSSLIKELLMDNSKAQVLYDPYMPHAGYMLDLDWQQQILDHTQQLISAGKSPAAAAAGHVKAHGKHHHHHLQQHHHHKHAVPTSHAAAARLTVRQK